MARGAETDTLACVSTSDPCAVASPLHTPITYRPTLHPTIWKSVLLMVSSIHWFILQGILPSPEPSFSYSSSLVSEHQANTPYNADAH